MLFAFFTFIKLFYVIKHDVMANIITVTIFFKNVADFSWRRTLRDSTHDSNSNDMKIRWEMKNLKELSHSDNS